MRDKQQKEQKEQKEPKENRDAAQRQADWEQAESHRKAGDRPANAEVGRPGSTAPKPQRKHDTLHDPGQQTPDAPPTDNRS